MPNVIREYLVALGFHVDSAAYNKIQSTLNQLDNAVEKHTGVMAANYMKASTTIVSSLVAIGAATVDLLNKVAQADLGYEKFAMRMYMARDAAKQMKIVTDAMGESLDDIAWIPELNQRYQILMKEARGMEQGGDARGQLQYLRDVRMEYTRLKLEATYGLQWVAYYFVKSFINPIDASKMSFKDLNDYIQKNIQPLAKKVALFLREVYDYGVAIVRFVKDLYLGLQAVFSILPEGARGFAMLVTAAGVLFAVGGPFTRALAVLGLLVAAIKDFYDYIDGKKSNPVLSPIWEALISIAYRLAKYWNYASIAIDEFNRSYSKFGVAGLVNDKHRDELERKAFGGLMSERIKKRTDEWDKANPAWTRENVPIQRSQTLGDNDIVRQAQRVSEATGIPAEYIYGHWYHETGGFKNRGARELNNLAGVNVPGGRGQDYKKYGNLDEFGDDYIGMMKGRYKNTLGARSSDEYMAALKEKGYFTGPLGPAQAGARRGAQMYYESYQTRYGSNAPEGQGNQTNVNINMYGMTNDEMVRQTEEVIKRYNDRAIIQQNRFPAISGVTP